MILTKRLLLCSTLASASLFAVNIAVTSDAKAAGFYIQEQSVKSLGSAFSGSVTNLQDPSTVYFNPAGMTKLKGTQFQAAAHLLVPNASLSDTGSTYAGGATSMTGDDGGNPYEPTPVPNAFLTHQINDNFWAGVSVTAPFGLANHYGNNWFGRFDSINTELKVIDIQPSLAYKVNDKLSIAGGLNLQRSEARLSQAAYAGAGTEGISTLDGSESVAVGYNLGFILKPLPKTSFGVSYHSAIQHELEGTIKTEGTGVADFDVAGEAELNLPEIVKMGVAHELNDKLTLQGQATWFGWNEFHDITSVTNESFSILGGAITRNPGEMVSSITQGYQNTWTYSVGAEYKASDQWTVRGGMQFDETPTTDQYRTSRTPDGDRTWLSAGATYQMSDSLALDFSGTYIWIEDGTIDVDRNNSFSTAVQSEVKANTSGSVGIFAMGVTYKF